MKLKKEKLKEYLSLHPYDVTIDELIEYFELDEREVKKLNEFLDELAKIEFIDKIWCSQHKKYEYETVK